jgi:hypothetical protein
MAKTLPDLVSEVRALVQDERASSYRYSDSRVLAQINSSFREVYRLRPDAFSGCCSDDGVTVPTYVLADLAVVPAIEFPIDELFWQPVVFHVVGVLELADDEFANDGKAISLMTAFQRTLVGA